MTKVFLVDNKYDADYCVCFVDNNYDEKNADIIKDGILVNNKYDANVKVFIVQGVYDAKILITHEHFPK